MTFDKVLAEGIITEFRLDEATVQQIINVTKKGTIDNFKKEINDRPVTDSSGKSLGREEIIAMAQKQLTPAQLAKMKSVLWGAIDVAQSKYSAKQTQANKFAASYGR